MFMKKILIQLKYCLKNIMAEGEDPFSYKDPDLDNNLDNDDEQQVDMTRPFQPGGASTPYYRGEQYEMQTMMHEQSGLPDASYEETPLLTNREAQNQISWGGGINQQIS